MTTKRLAGGRVLVVGAGTDARGNADAPVGNGRAIAILAAREGAAVVCADRDEGAASATAELIREEGGAADVIVADVAREEECERLVDEAGDLTGLVLNVGIGRGGSGLARTSADDWDVTFQVNLRSHFLVTRAALPRLPEAASIVFISSVAGLRAGSRVPAYDASKAGIIGLSRHVALEAARRGVRANVVAPGLIDTPIGREASGGRPSRELTPVPLGRQGSAWEVAALTAFLLSGDASYITGEVITVDGGLHLI